jgi:hypothetical protein
LPDALGLGGLELAQQVPNLPSIVALGLGFKNRDDSFDFVNAQVYADLDLAYVCV